MTKCLCCKKDSAARICVSCLEKVVVAIIALIVLIALGVLLISMRGG